MTKSRENAPRDRAPRTGDRPIAVVIVAHTRLYREGLAEALNRSGQVRVVGTAAEGLQALSAIWELQPDMALVDMGIPSRSALVHGILEATPGVKVIGLAVPDAETELIACAETGVAGLVTRECTLGELLEAIEGAGRGELLCSARTAGALLRRVAALSASAVGGPTAPQLTSREREVAKLVAEGLSNKEIARQLTIEVATVKNHVHRVLEKLQAKRRSEIAARVGAWRLPREAM